MQMRRQAIAQLARIRRQVNTHLLEFVDHLAGRRLVAAELARDEALALLGAADDRPHEQVGHVDGHRLRQRRELGCVRPDHARVAARREREDVEGSDLLLKAVVVSISFW